MHVASNWQFHPHHLYPHTLSNTEDGMILMELMELMGLTALKGTDGTETELMRLIRVRRTLSDMCVKKS